MSLTNATVPTLQEPAVLSETSTPTRRTTVTETPSSAAQTRTDVSDSQNITRGNSSDPNKDLVNGVASGWLSSQVGEGLACRSENIKHIQFENHDSFYCDTSALVAENAQVDGVMLLTIPNPQQLVDEHSNRLEPSAGATWVMTWLAPNQTRVVLPLFFPRKLEGYDVAPVMKWAGQTVPRVLSGWQIWLVDRATSQPILKLEHPFIVLEPNETIHFDFISGYLEVYGSTWTGRNVGVQLTAPNTIATGNTVASAIATPAISTGLEPPRAKPTAVIDGIALYDFTPEDVAYIKASLDWLETATPNWFQYLMAQKPFWIQYDAETEASPYADGICCDANGAGRIRVFAHSLADKTLSSWGISGHQVARTFLLGLLIHEATHIGQQHRGEMAGNTCVTIEQQAYAAQFAAIQAMAHAKVGAPSLQQDYEENFAERVNLGSATKAAELDCNAFVQH